MLRGTARRRRKQCQWEVNEKLLIDLAPCDHHALEQIKRLTDLEIPILQKLSRGSLINGLIGRVVFIFQVTGKIRFTNIAVCWPG